VRETNKNLAKIKKQNKIFSALFFKIKISHRKYEAK